jgi:carbamoyltransferase
MNILGLNLFHADTAACLIINGKIIAAIEEERFDRIKHSDNFPLNAIKFCLETGNLRIEDIDYIAVNFNNDYNFKEKIFFILKNLFKKNIYKKISNFLKKKTFFSYFLKNFNFDIRSSNIKIVYVPHHLAHIASTVIPFNIKNGLAFSFDGSGDFSTVEIYKIKNEQYNLIEKNIYPHSLGIFYQAFTQFLGFPNYGDEYKVMGLAAYGDPVFTDRIYKVLKKGENLINLNLKFFQHHLDTFSYQDSRSTPKSLYSDVIEIAFGSPRKKNEPIVKLHMDIAASVQKVFEDIVLSKIQNLYENYPSENFCLSGGCAFNSVLLGKIKKYSNFKNIYAFCNMGDAGGALGAALFACKKYDKIIENEKNLLNPFLGFFSTNEYIGKKIVPLAKTTNCNFLLYQNEDKLLEFVTKEICQGKVVGWYQGRSEWGPRALGNRSILADPRRPNMRDIINSKIKRREEFRPYAPSILEDHASTYFDMNGQSPYMGFVFEAKQIAKDKIPSCVHVDGTSRVQTVNLEFNERFYKLISAFYKKTDVPILLNTSLNVNEPICNSPEDAWKVFSGTFMDTLVLEDWVFFK